MKKLIILLLCGVCLGQKAPTVKTLQAKTSASSIGEQLRVLGETWYLEDERYSYEGTKPHTTNPYNAQGVAAMTAKYMAKVRPLITSAESSRHTLGTFGVSEWDAKQEDVFAKVIAGKDATSMEIRNAGIHLLLLSK